MTAEPIRIVVAGSPALMCDRARAAIEALPDANLVGEVANGEQAIGEQAISAVRELDPNVFILDMEIPGVHALIVTRTVLKARPHLGIVAWLDLSEAGFLPDEKAYWMQHAGVCCCVDDHSDQIEIERAITFAAQGTKYLSSRLAQRATLSGRDHEILTLIATGWTNTHIAKALKITPSTVSSHTMRICRKLNVTGRAEAEVRGRELGLSDFKDYHSKRQEFYQVLHAFRQLD